MTTHARVDIAVPVAVINQRRRRCRFCARWIVLWPHPTTRNYVPLDIASAAPGIPGVNQRLESHFAHCSRQVNGERNQQGPPDGTSTY